MEKIETPSWTDIFDESFQTRSLLKAASNKLDKEFLLMWKYNGKHKDKIISEKLSEIQKQQTKLQDVMEWLNDLEEYCLYIAI